MTRSVLCLLFVAAGCNVSGDEPGVESRTSNAETASTADIAPPLPPSASPVVAPPSPAPSASAASSSTSVDPEVPPPPCPEGMALVGRFCVDKWEASLEVIGDDGIHSPHPHYERLEKGKAYYAVSKSGLFPQGYISRVESKAACEAAGKRLCKRNEWQRACRGEGWMRYPYGNKAVRGKCSSGKLHLLREKFGDNPKGGWKYDEHFNSPDLNREPGYLARGGEYDGCVTDLGVADMVGNLHEWVSDTVDQEFMDKLDTEDVERNYQPWHSGNGVFMGGFYSTTGEHGPGCLFTTVAHEPTYHDYSTGFRCCKAAELPLPEKKAPDKKKQPEKKTAEKKPAEQQ